MATPDTPPALPPKSITLKFVGEDSWETFTYQDPIGTPSTPFLQLWLAAPHPPFVPATPPTPAAAPPPTDTANALAIPQILSKVDVVPFDAFDADLRKAINAVFDAVPALDMSARPSLLPLTRQPSLNALRPEVTTDWKLTFHPREIAFPCYTTPIAFQRVLERTFLSSLDFAVRAVKYAQDPLITAYLNTNVPPNPGAVQRLQSKEQKRWKYHWAPATFPEGSGIVGWEYRPQDGRSGGKALVAALPFWEFPPEKFASVIRSFKREEGSATEKTENTKLELIVAYCKENNISNYIVTTGNASSCGVFPLSEDFVPKWSETTLTEVVTFGSYHPVFGSAFPEDDVKRPWGALPLDTQYAFKGLPTTNPGLSTLQVLTWFLLTATQNYSSTGPVQETHEDSAPRSPQPERPPSPSQADIARANGLKVRDFGFEPEFYKRLREEAGEEEPAFKRARTEEIRETTPTDVGTSIGDHRGSLLIHFPTNEAGPSNRPRRAPEPDSEEREVEDLVSPLRPLPRPKPTHPSPKEHKIPAPKLSAASAGEAEAPRRSARVTNKQKEDARKQLEEEREQRRELAKKRAEKSRVPTTVTPEKIKPTRGSKTKAVDTAASGSSKSKSTPTARSAPTRTSARNKTTATHEVPKAVSAPAAPGRSSAKRLRQRGAGEEENKPAAEEPKLKRARGGRKAAPEPVIDPPEASTSKRTRRKENTETSVQADRLIKPPPKPRAKRGKAVVEDVIVQSRQAKGKGKQKAVDLDDAEENEEEPAPPKRSTRRTAVAAKIEGAGPSTRRR